MLLRNMYECCQRKTSLGVRRDRHSCLRVFARVDTSRRRKAMGRYNEGHLNTSENGDTKMFLNKDHSVRGVSKTVLEDCVLYTTQLA